MSEQRQTVTECPHHRRVDCPVEDRRCSRCGWYPEVEKRRRKDAQRRMKEMEGKK